MHVKLTYILCCVVFFLQTLLLSFSLCSNNNSILHFTALGKILRSSMCDNDSEFYK